MKTKAKIKSLINSPSTSYIDAKNRSIEIDDLLDYQCILIEINEFKENKTSLEFPHKKFWVGLDTQIFQTPYSEIVEMIKEINPQALDHWLDLGSAYGRMGIVLHFNSPEVQFTGFEMLQARVDEGNRIFDKWNCINAKLIKTDIADSAFILPSADLYFIYDFGSREDIYLILDKLKMLAMQKPIKVVARGRGVKQWIMLDHPWLSQINSPKHYENWSLFCS